MKSAWGSHQKTEVVDVKSQVIDVVTEGALYVVSVRFLGQIRENGTLNNLNEIWHLEKPRGRQAAAGVWRAFSRPRDRPFRNSSVKVKRPASAGRFFPP